MTVSYQELTRLAPHAFATASNDVSKAVHKLATEYTQYQTNVLTPLKTKHHWSGGGQPDAAAVAEANGLAIDTMRLRAAAGTLAYIYGSTGFQLAKARLAALEKQIEADDMKVDSDGNVSAKQVPVGDDNGPGSTSQKVQNYQKQIGQILKFAGTVDGKFTASLNTSHEPPVVSLVNYAGLLDQARKDNRDAADDAQGVLADLHDLADDANKQLPAPGDDGIPDLPGIHVEYPPGAAANTLGYGLYVVGIFTMLYGGYIGGGSALALNPEGVAVGVGGAAAGAILAGIGAGAIRASGGRLPTVTTTAANGAKNTYSLDDITQLANKAERQADPGYGATPTAPSEIPQGARNFDPEVASKVSPWGPNDGKTRGELVLGGQKADNSHALTSGYSGEGADAVKEMTPPRRGMNNRLQAHVEAQAAAMMRKTDTHEATLYLNRLPCTTEGTNCSNQLSNYLAPGDKLTIYGPDGYARVFVGK